MKDKEHVVEIKDPLLAWSPEKDEMAYYCRAKQAGKVKEQMEQIAKINPEKIIVIEADKRITELEAVNRSINKIIDGQEETLNELSNENEKLGAENSLLTKLIEKFIKGKLNTWEAVKQANEEVCAERDALKEQLRWIPVSEGLPWKSGYYLFRKNKQVPFVAIHYAHQTIKPCGITHWKTIQLPEAEQ